MVTPGYPPDFNKDQSRNSQMKHFGMKEEVERIEMKTGEKKRNNHSEKP